MATDTTSAPMAAHSRLAERVQIAANIAVILACVGIGWLLWLRMHQPVPEAPPTYAIGEHVEAIDGVDFGAAAQTLVMVLREDCRFCRESLPFYQRLTAANRKAGERALRMVVASTDTPVSLSIYLKAREVQVDHVAGVQLGQLKVPGTPFLMLVDSTGTVKRLWRGRLPASGEQEVFKTLGLLGLN